MNKHTRGFAGLSLLLSVVLVLFMAACMCIMPGLFTKSANASPGSGWEDQTPIPDGEALFAVDAVNSDVAWVVGDGGTILKTSDGGESWEIQNSVEGQNLKEVCAVDSSVAWAVGNAGADAVVLNTDDGGATWVSHDVVTDLFRVVPGGEYINNVYADGVAALDADTAWVTVNYYASVPNPFYPPFYIQSVNASSIWKTTDGGEGWTLQYFSLLPERLFNIYALDGLTVWTAGGNLTDSYPFVPVSTALKSVDGGATWITQNPQAPWAIYDFSVVDYNIAWGSIFTKTIDGGASWIPMDPVLSYHIRDFAAVDADVAWGLGIIGVAQGKQGIISKTLDGGQTYTTQYSGTTNYLYGICALDGAVAWVVGEKGIILKTENGGDTKPDILSISQTSGDVGSEVTITGCDFGDTQGTAYVSFGSTQATAYTSWSDTEIVVEVPAGVTGTILVTVTTAEGISNGVGFTVQTVLPPCGTGGSTALLMLGLTLGLLSLAGSSSILRKRKRG